MSLREFSPSLSSTHLIAGALLTLLAIMLFNTVRQESQTFDESIHLYAGLEYWKHGDFGTNPEHPPLAKMLAALPLLPMGLTEPPHFPAPFFKIENFINGSKFLYGDGKADSILLRGRMIMALFSLGLGWLVYLAADEMFGPLAGLIALSLFVLEPVVLANSALVTTDMPLACLFFAAVYAFYRFLKRPSVWRLVLCAGAAGLAMAVKHSGALVLPTLLLLGLGDHFTRHFSLDDALAQALDGRPRRLSLAQLAGVLAVIGLVSYAMLWAVYGFRYAARPGDLAMAPTLANYAAGLSPLKQATILFLARFHLFPEAYLYGWTDILLNTSYRSTFIFGRLFPTGQWFFFPGVFLIKSTLTLLSLLLLVPFAGFLSQRRALLFVSLPAGFFLLVSVSSMLNLGVGHILPIYPFCIVLAAAAGAALAARSRAGQVAVGALLAVAAISSLRAFPDYLAYSNEAFGGPKNTWREVADSNDNRGQGLKWIKAYLDRHPASECWLDYMDPMVDPAYYGIPCKPLPSSMGLLVGLAPASVPSTISGTILISTTDITGLLSGPGSLNPYQRFLERKPDDRIGNVILVYRGTFDVSLLAALTDAVNVRRLLSQNQVPEALALAESAVQLAPDSARANRALADALSASGRAAEAQKALAAAQHLAQTVHPEYQRALI
jgi:tetratricopeptide (TPR) repeat protein